MLKYILLKHIMHRSTLVLISLLLVFSCNPSPKALTTSHILPAETDIRLYASIVFRETPYARQKGMIKLTSEQAQVRSHYQFTFDQHERIIEISFKQGDVFKAPNHTADAYQYPATTVRTQYQGNEEIKTFYNRFETQIAVRGDVFEEVYELDSLGNRKVMYYRNKSGERIENEWGVAQYTWELQNDGSVIEQRFDLSGDPQPLRPGFPFYRIRLHYDSNGYISLMQNIDEQGNLIENETGVAQDKIEFDGLGRWLGWKVLDKNGAITEGNGPNVARGINTPNEFGYETAIRFEDRDGHAKRNSYGFWGSKRFYDQHGNYERTYFTDSLGNPAPNEITGYTYAIYEWDATGQVRTSTQLLDVNKKPVAHKTRGYSSVKFEYDDSNQMTKASFFDENGQLVNRIDNGAAFIEFKYDEHGIRTARIMYDRSGTELSKSK